MSRLVSEALCGSLRVRKWICREAILLPNRSLPSVFPELVQRYARMTDRLIKALQALGVTTNGADAARIASSLGMPTTAKTIIRRVLQLPLPSEGEGAKVGIDEWAWKKGLRYGTILVTWKSPRIVQLVSRAFRRNEYSMVRRCAHDGEASTKPYERASRLSRSAHPEQGSLQQSQRRHVLPDSVEEGGGQSPHT